MPHDTQPSPSSPSAAPDATDAARQDAETAHWRKRELALALRNGIKLGSSLIATWGIALIVRLYVPRVLGPDRFGQLSFAEAFTTTAFVTLGLGVDTYIRKEISVRPEHASDFIGGVVALRIGFAALIFLGMDLVLQGMGKGADIRELVFLYGLAQFFGVGSLTSSGLLHAKGAVNEMSVLSVAIKILWGLSILAVIWLGLDLWAFGVAFVLSESLRSLVLFRLAKKHLNLKARVDIGAAWRVVVASAPFYLASVATTIYGKLDISILTYLESEREVGWYGAATGLAGLTLLLVPLISWVLMPLFARAAATSEKELCSLVCRSLELILAFTVPVSLLMSMGSELWIGIAFGPAFAPAAAALSVQAVVFIMMYVSIVSWAALTMLNRTWALTAVFTVGLIVNPILNFTLIPLGVRQFGPGGGGVACATATLLTEVFVLSPMLWMMGKRIAERRLLMMVGKTLAAAAITVALDHFLKPHLGVIRIVPLILLYLLIVLVTRAIDVKETLSWGKAILQERRKPKAQGA